MAYTHERFTKDGQRYFEIRVRRGRSASPVSKNWYPPKGWSDKRIQDALEKEATRFEDQVKAGEIKSYKERQEEAAQKALEAAKLKTVRQYSEGVFMAAKEAIMSENGKSNYRMYLDKHINPFIGDLLLVDVTPPVIKKLILDFQKKGYSHASTIKLYNILSGIFDMAFEDGAIPVSPMLRIKRPVQGKTDTAIDDSEKALTEEQLKTLLKHMDSESLKWKVYVYLSADTWMRRGEMCALRWSDIDRDSAIITVRHNLQYLPNKGVYETSPKNGKARKIDIGADTLELLDQLKKEQASICLSKYVFSQNGSSEPMNPQTPTRYFRKLGSLCGLPEIHPHTLRHTGISIAIANGADVVSVSRRAGHTDSAVTLRMYAHATEESIRRAGQIYRDALREKQG